MKDKARKDPEDLYAHRNDPGEWANEPAQIEVRSARMSVVSFRLPAEELEILSDAARAMGETLSEYIRTAVKWRVQGIALSGMTVAVSGTMVTSHPRAWTESATRYNEPVPVNS
jgi:hypothetical protein